MGVIGLTTARGGSLIGFETLEEHASEAMHVPVVIVAVFMTVPVAEAATVLLTVTIAVWFAASVTLKVHVLPVGFAAVHMSGEVTVHDGEAVSMSCDGMESVTTAEPAPSPTFVMAMV
jgi:hypothetical protein